MKNDADRGHLRDFAGLESSIFLAAQDVSRQSVERHGSIVDHVLLYRTVDGLIADEDVVEGAGKP